jgi:hypothetical protein
VQDGRLAGAVRADQAERLAAPDAQVEVVQDFHLAVAGAQALDGHVRLGPAQRGDALGRHSGGGDGGGPTVDLLDRDDRVDRAAVVAGGVLLLVVAHLGHQWAPR